MLLSLENVWAYYGKFPALHGVTLQVDRGEVVTLLGSNGAGKTTLLKTLSGLLKIHSGAISFSGKRIELLSPNAIVGLGISQCPEGRKLFPEMTVLKNLRLGAYIRRRDEKGIAVSLQEVLSLFPILSERARQLAGTLSGGEQQMLAMGRALMSNPAVLLLDEPSLGLAPLVVRTLFQTIRKINARQTTIFLVEQNASQALKVAHRGYVMETGQIVLSGRCEDLLNEEKVKQAYLGA
ncbi:MAG: transporter ATP-binding protein [Deltaproteobacteria bacterium]|nr:transporter ATP-binding protein [Deltaproteobacteria bacterium]